MNTAHTDEEEVQFWLHQRGKKPREVTLMLPKNRTYLTAEAK